MVQNRWNGYSAEDIAAHMAGISQDPDRWLAASLRDSHPFWYMLADSLWPAKKLKAKKKADRLWLCTIFQENRNHLKTILGSVLGCSIHRPPTPLASSTPAPPSTTNCICMKKHNENDADMIECTSCKVWYHGDCIGVNVEAVGPDPSWRCQRCKGLRIAKFPNDFLRSFPVPVLTLDDISIISPLRRPVAVSLDATPPAPSVIEVEPGSRPLQSQPIVLEPVITDEPIVPEVFASGNSYLPEIPVTPYPTSVSSQLCDPVIPDVIDLTAVEDAIHIASDDPSIRIPSVATPSNTEHHDAPTVYSKRCTDFGTPVVGSYDMDARDMDCDMRVISRRKTPAKKKYVSKAIRKPKFTTADPRRSFEFLVDIDGFKKFIGQRQDKKCLLRGWTDFVEESFRKVNKQCVLVFKKTRFTPDSPSCFIYTRGHCGHPNCSIFIMECKEYRSGQPLRFTCRFHGLFDHGRDAMRSRKVQNYIREGHRQKLRHQTCASLATEIHSKIDMEGIRAGNENSRPERNLFPHMKYEEMKKNDNCTDDLYDVIEEWKKELFTQDRFIRALSLSPFHVVMFTDEQLNVLRQLHTRKYPVVAHLDATGTLIREIKNIEGTTRTYMYALAVANPYPGYCPLAVCEFITNEHTADSVSTCLNGFVKKSQIGALKPTDIFSRIETDFSLPLIHASLRVFGNIEIRPYITRCFQELRGMEEPFKTNFHVCRIHTINAFMRQVSTVYKHQQDIIPDLKCLYVRFLMSRTLSDCEYYATKILVLCMNEFRTKAVENAITTLRHQPLVGRTVDANLDDAFMKATQATDETSFYKSTCFGVMFNDKATVIQQESLGDTSRTPNPYYSAVFAEHLIRDILPYTPLLTHVMFDTRGDDYMMDHQWPVEYWNKIVKVDEEKAGRKKLGRYIRDAKEIVKARSKDFETTLIKQSGLARQGRTPSARSNKRKVKTKGLHNHVNRKSNLRNVRTATKHRTPRRSTTRVPKRILDSVSYRQPDPDELEECWDRKGRQVARPQTCSHPFNRLPFVLWDSRARDLPRTEFYNTCPVDNVLMILNFLDETYSDIRAFFERNDLPDMEVVSAVRQCLNYVRQCKFNHAKKHWFLHVSRHQRFIRAFENVSPGELFHFDMVGCEHEHTGQALQTCMQVFNEVANCGLHEHINPMGTCEYWSPKITKIVSQINGEASARGICYTSGCMNTWLSLKLQINPLYDPVPFVLLCPSGSDESPDKGTRFENLPPQVSICSRVYKLAAASLYQTNPAHFFTVFPWENELYVYNGMHSNNKIIRVNACPRHNYASTVWYRLTPR